MISFDVSGSSKKTEAFLRQIQKLDIPGILDANGQAGVIALENATPIDSGVAENSWAYEVSVKSDSCTITWTNSDVESGFPVVIMLQYGYGTGTGGYVQGRDFINPAIKPVFDDIETKVWKAVISA